MYRFTVNGQPTITAKNGRTDFGRSRSMTELDQRKVNRAYCDEDPGPGTGNGCGCVVNNSWCQLLAPPFALSS